ncbi:MAG: C40 family peptidase [Flavobacteriaceae bacterium]|nr:C40 family peptidase [Flavobacteriaceae bacterium]
MKYRQLVILFIGILMLASCGTMSRDTGRKSGKVDNSATGRAKTVLNEAHTYLGTKYKYGGIDRRGMDCSGLVFRSFQKVNIDLPRSSREQASKGMNVNLRNIKPGDLLFFNTSGSSISHVGIVDKVKNGEIFFIHSSTSKGVIVSSLEETYWNRRFVKAVRYLH